MGAFMNGLRMALRAISRNVLRASLTVLGILIGVWAVIGVMAAGAGARDSVGAKIEGLGSNLIIVFPTNSAASGAHGAQGTGVRLSEEDGRAVMREAVSVKTLTPVLRARAQAVYGERNWSTSAIGTTIPYLFIRNWKIQRGEMWTEHDEAAKAKVCVLGTTAARNLFGDEDPVGRSIRIGRYPFRVVGVLESKGETPFGEDQDDQIAMPIGSMRARIMRTPPGFAGVFFVSATAPETADRAVSQIDSILRQRHHIAADRQPDFEIHSQKEFQTMQRTVYNVLTVVGVFIAFISLVVGGIGVMNIMLVSVTERTREIGIRMAIGARESDIRTQFLSEAVILSSLGGAAGAIAGVGTVGILSLIFGWHIAVDPVPLTIAVGVSALTGIIFGFLPARRASRLDPIEALRHE